VAEPVTESGERAMLPNACGAIEPANSQACITARPASSVRTDQQPVLGALSADEALGCCRPDPSRSGDAAAVAESMAERSRLRAAILALRDLCDSI